MSWTISTSPQPLLVLSTTDDGRSPLLFRNESRSISAAESQTAYSSLSRLSPPPPDSLPHVLPHAVFVGQQRPQRGVRKELQPQHLFIVGLRPLQIGIVSERHPVEQSRKGYGLLHADVITAFDACPPVFQTGIQRARFACRSFRVFHCGGVRG